MGHILFRALAARPTFALTPGDWRVGCRHAYSLLSRGLVSRLKVSGLTDPRPDAPALSTLAARPPRGSSRQVARRVRHPSLRLAHSPDHRRSVARRGTSSSGLPWRPPRRRWPGAARTDVGRAPLTSDLSGPSHTSDPHHTTSAPLSALTALAALPALLPAPRQPPRPMHGAAPQL
jgi:hypothetical protein